jgi:hypothetical protein
LVQVLRNGACGARTDLGDDDWLRLVTWIDANAPYHANFINKRPPAPPYDLPADRELISRITAVHARRCQACHEPAAVSPAYWIDYRNPRDSLFLTAPLAKTAGGAQKCGQVVYHSQADEDYRDLLQTVESAVHKAWRYPRRDLRSLRLGSAYVAR